MASDCQDLLKLDFTFVCCRLLSGYKLTKCTVTWVNDSVFLPTSIVALVFKPFKSSTQMYFNVRDCLTLPHCLLKTDFYLEMSVDCLG